MRARGRAREFRKIAVPRGGIGRAEIDRDAERADPDAMGLLESDAERLALMQPAPERRARATATDLPRERLEHPCSRSYAPARASSAILRIARRPLCIPARSSNAVR